HWRGGAVRVDVVDRPPRGGHGLQHAARGTFTGGGHHVVAVGGGAVAGEFRVDGGAARQGMVERLDHQHTAAAGDDEAVALRVIGARGLVRRGVVLGGERAHGVEHAAQRPVLVLSATGEDEVLLAELDLLHGVADAVRAGGTGGGNGVVDALD